MSRQPEPLREYKNEQLMSDYNDLMIRIKTHLFNLGADDFKRRHPKPSNEEIDKMMQDVFVVLREDSRPMRKY